MFRKLLGVPRLLDAARAHYWTQPSQDSVRPPAGGGALGPDELQELRRGLLTVARTLLRQSVQPGNWQAKPSWADVQVQNHSTGRVLMERKLRAQGSAGMARHCSAPQQSCLSTSRQEQRKVAA